MFYLVEGPLNVPTHNDNDNEQAVTRICCYQNIKQREERRTKPNSRLGKHKRLKPWPLMPRVYAQRNGEFKRIDYIHESAHTVTIKHVEREHCEPSSEEKIGEICVTPHFPEKMKEYPMRFVLFSMVSSCCQQILTDVNKRLHGSTNKFSRS